MALKDEILRSYFATHKELIEAEQLDEDNALFSFPLHIVGNHRIEVSVTKTDGVFLLSDTGRIISDLKDYGYSISRSLLERMAHIARPANVRIVNGTLVMDCPQSEIGGALHIFAEAAKTIGDAYLAFPAKTSSEKRLLEDVARVLDESHLAYRVSHKVEGNIEKHTVDFYMPPNGHPGLALEILGGYSTHMMAQVWYFKCNDMRLSNSRLKFGIIYDIENSTWSAKSQEILQNVADFALPSTDLPRLPDTVKSAVE
jgi:hypothetical protein